MFEVQYTEISRTPGAKNKWEVFNDGHKRFKDLQGALEYVKENYGLAKTKTRQYIDDKDGKAKPCGWIYSWKERETCGVHYVQAWVSIYKIEFEVVKW